MKDLKDLIGSMVILGAVFAAIFGLMYAVDKNSVGALLLTIALGFLAYFAVKGLDE